jgi:hypothetical protein
MKVFIKVNGGSNDSQLNIPIEIKEEESSSSSSSNHLIIPSKHLYQIVSDFFEINEPQFRLVNKNGIQVPFKDNKQTILTIGDHFRLYPLVYGGKGGFGSLLRTFGKQITLSTNKEACRDLTGRRMRHVNNERRIKEFIEKQAELAKEQEEQKKDRIERKRKKIERLDNKHHQFSDANYDSQKQQIFNDLDEAISKGIKNKRKLSKDKKKQTNDDNSNQEEEEDEATTSKKALANDANKVDNNLKDSKLTPISTQTVITATTTVTAVKSKKANVDDKLKDWMGLGDIEVSSSDSESDSDTDCPPSKVKSNSYFII